jgi:hypothetical protein
MNPPGGAIRQIWHPPISIDWIIAVVLILLSTNVSALPPIVAKVFLHPAGFFLTFVCAICAYDSQYIPITFSLLFFLFMIWTRHQRGQEGFAVSGAIDWVGQGKRWYVESVLKETPLGIKEKDVSTYPVQGDSSMPGGRS